MSGIIGVSPDMRSGVVGKYPDGHVLQCLSTTKTDTFYWDDPAYTDITGLSIAITPNATSSKIYVTASVPTCAAAGTRIAFQFVRDSTSIGIGDASSSRTRATSGDDYTSPASPSTSTFSFLDSPSSTSATTYKVQIAFIDPAGYVYVNRTVNDDDSVNRGRMVSTITVMEIVA